MTKHFQNEIDRLKKKLLFLAAGVEQSLNLSIAAILEADLKKAKKVIDGDSKIDSLEVEVEEDCLKILALHQPVAADLRYIVAVLKINSDLERIADLAVNISERVRTISRYKAVQKPYDLNIMLTTAVKMVKDSVDSLVSSDTKKAYQVIEEDDDIDAQEDNAFKVTHKHIKQNPQNAKYYVSLLSVSRYLERIADHATNIAEDVIYMIDGEIVRHQSNQTRY